MKTIRTESGLLVYLLVFVMTFFLLTGKAVAKEVQEQFHGLSINANLELAEGKQMQDGVILLTHGLLMHNGMEIIRTLQTLFKEHGYNSLAINYSLNIDDRHGQIDCNAPHHHSRQKSLDEIGFWLTWLKKNNVRKIILAGHSSGANDIAEYHSHNPDPAITHLLMITPATSDHSMNTPAGYRSRYHKDVNIILAKAQKMVDAGRGNEIMLDTDFLFCPAAPVTAATFVSYYGGYSSVRLLPTQLQRINIPTIFIAAGADNISTDMSAIVKPYVDGKRIQLVTIDGASHFLRDLYLEDAVDAMVSFLQK
jgi:pimeloyl-ACP methyl ester carboxylesterase